MPVRKLMYAARLYDKYIHMNKLNIYSTKQIRLPVPKLVTYYNGKEDEEVLSKSVMLSASCRKR